MAPPGADVEGDDVAELESLLSAVGFGAPLRRLGTAASQLPSLASARARWEARRCVQGVGCCHPMAQGVVARDVEQELC